MCGLQNALVLENNVWGPTVHMPQPEQAISEHVPSGVALHGRADAAGSASDTGAYFALYGQPMQQHTHGIPHLVTLQHHTQHMEQLRYSQPLVNPQMGSITELDWGSVPSPQPHQGFAASPQPHQGSASALQPHQASFDPSSQDSNGGSGPSLSRVSMYAQSGCEGLQSSLATQAGHGVLPATIPGPRSEAGGLPQGSQTNPHSNKRARVAASGLPIDADLSSPLVDFPTEVKASCVKTYYDQACLQIAWP